MYNNPITLTTAAAERIKFLLSQQPEAKGLRVGVKTKGCSGLSYTIEYAKEPNSLDTIVLEHDVAVYIDAKAAMYIFGTEMDYVQENMKSGFIFRNPNEKGRCGCGQSFHV
ncbi:MAG TPA: iron-sulfur cluster assembly accessory protein [Alphaproteobacteria bacterium]|jgi:iron-sulfur cluster assembly protein|nr:iron-sulfur cluster assembly accessory protein [Alphaproteobacteria bacterium]